MCSRKRNSDSSIPGNYQYKAMHYGPVSQRLWHQQKLVLLERFLRTRQFGRVCDIGCGSGIVTSYVAKICPDAEVVGIDVSSESISFAKSQYTDSKNLTFYNRDLLDTGGTGLNTFDFVYATEVIEHLSKDNVQKFLMALGRLGHRRTQYLVTTPDYGSMWPILERILDLASLVPKLRGHQHLSQFTKDRLTHDLVSAGFRVARIYNFCGWSPFWAHVSLPLSQWFQEREQARGEGFLICCEFTLDKENYDE